MQLPARKLLTVGQIAERLSVPVHRVRYILETRLIDHTAEAAGARVFSPDALRRVRYELNVIEARRHSGHAHSRRHAGGASNG